LLSLTRAGNHEETGQFERLSRSPPEIFNLIRKREAKKKGAGLQEAKGMFTQRLYRSLGLAAHLSWARLLVDHY
jgi:hypothetical protein